MARKKKLPRERVKVNLQTSDVVLEMVGVHVKLTAATFLPDEYAEAIIDALKAQAARRVWPPEVFIVLEVEKPEGPGITRPSGSDETPSKHSEEEQDDSSTA